ncbi:MAG: HAMP domain-containing protein [Gemmatimonadetes bacterium]|nr:HAMP domain-containing protein [Gemmatimonadota bacterium]
MGRLSPLGLRIFALSGLTIAAAVGVTFLVIQSVSRQVVGRSIGRSLIATQASIQDKLEARSRALRAGAERLAAVPSYLAGVEQGLAAGDRGSLLDLADELRRQLEADWALITDAGGILEAWSDHPDRVGIDLSPGALIGLAMQGASTEGVWLEPSDSGERIYQAVAVPFRLGPDRVPLGILVAALGVDSGLAAALKRNTDSEVLFFTRDTAGAPVANTGTISVAADLIAALGADTAPGRVTVERDGVRWVGGVGVLRSAAGTPLAGFVGLRSWAEEIAPFERLRYTVIGSLVVALALALAASAWLATRITKPVRGLVAATRRIEQGDFEAPLPPVTRDEIGELTRAFGQMVAELKEKQRLVDFLSAGPPAGSTPTGAGDVALSALDVGTVLAGRYELREHLGSGGMGVVYRAFDRELSETVALKTLHPALHANDPVFLERFKQEIRLARRITHRNVVRTHDLGEHAGIYFITMEYAEGTSLDRLIARRGRLPLDVALTVVKQLLRALEVAHEAGVIHRDIKPGNLLVDPTGVVKVMDFGIARLAESGKNAALTHAGSVVGSPDYMAPEQLLGEEVDHRVDIYATGCVMFEALSGRRVHDAPNVIALIARHLEEPVPSFASVVPELSGAVAALVDRALAKDRAARWPTAGAMLAAAEAIER